MRVQTLSSFRNPGHLMRAGMNILTTQVNSLRDYCGVITGHPMPPNYLYHHQQQQQQQGFHDLRYSPAPMSQLRANQINTIIEEDEAMIEAASLMTGLNRTPYAGYTASTVISNASGIGQLDTANNSALSALDNFQQRSLGQCSENINLRPRGQMTAGIGLFHGDVANDDGNDDLIDEPDRLIIYGEQRPMC
jgi:hypothetical protein